VRLDDKLSKGSDPSSYSKCSAGLDVGSDCKSRCSWYRKRRFDMCLDNSLEVD
jgi:hypothetical protein